MERPDAETTALFEAALPDDPRAVRGQMFGHPGAFVNGNLFFGTFAQTLIARVGEAEAAALVAKGDRWFAPRDGRAWKAYVQVARDDPRAAHLARVALEATAALPAKAGKGKAKVGKG